MKPRSCLVVAFALALALCARTCRARDSVVFVGSSEQRASAASPQSSRGSSRETNFAQPQRIPGARREAVTPTGMMPGVQARVLANTAYTTIYRLWRNSSDSLTNWARGFNLTLRNASSLARSFPNQAAVNTSFVQFDSGVRPQLSTSTQFIRGSTFQNSTILGQLTAGSANRNVYNGSVNGTRITTAGSNAATIIARGVFASPVRPQQQAQSAPKTDDGQGSPPGLPPQPPFQPRDAGAASQDGTAGSPESPTLLRRLMQS